MWQGEFRHPRLARVYDARFGWTRADEFFFEFANAGPRARVVDLGCGTGRLSLALAAAGHDVTGVDPAPASLAAGGPPGARDPRRRVPGAGGQRRRRAARPGRSSG